MKQIIENFPALSNQIKNIALISDVETASVSWEIINDTVNIHVCLKSDEMEIPKKGVAMINHVYVVEMYLCDRWEPCAGIGLDQPQAKKSLREWKDNNPDDKFRIARYERREGHKKSRLATKK